MTRIADIDRVILVVEILLAIGRNVVLVTSMFAGINIAFAAYNFAIGNDAWGIVHLMICLAALVFLAQIRQTRSRHRGKQAKVRQMPEKYHEAASA